jgi:AraC family transcriptional regulator, regulatory protein of adaptative response / methylated-DNA-[protein]-cysteine methyltransferase
VKTEPSARSEIAWRAVLLKDRGYDGKFVYGAVTTGIYCRPSCPARNPKRRNARMFRTADEAERRGYIACLRCHPNSLAPYERGIKAVLDHIETHLEETITLEQLATVARLSPHHLQQIFKRVVGLSPKAFCDAARVVRFKEHLKAGQSIAAACYQAGYGSSRALCERTKRSMGMTPSKYRLGGYGIHIRYSISREGTNTILSARTKVGLCAVLSGKKESALICDLEGEFPKAVLRRESSEKWKSAMHTLQVEDPLLSKFPRDLRERIFQARVRTAFTAAIV